MVIVMILTMIIVIPAFEEGGSCRLPAPPAIPGFDFALPWPTSMAALLRKVGKLCCNPRNVVNALIVQGITKNGAVLSRRNKSRSRGKKKKVSVTFMIISDKNVVTRFWLHRLLDRLTYLEEDWSFLEIDAAFLGVPRAADHFVVVNSNSFHMVLYVDMISLAFAVGGGAQPAPL